MNNANHFINSNSITLYYSLKFKEKYMCSRVKETKILPVNWRLLISLKNITALILRESDLMTWRKPEPPTK